MPDAHLFQRQPTERTANGAPADAIHLFPPDRRPWSISTEGVYLNDAPVPLTGITDLGASLDALLTLSRPSVLRNLPDSFLRPLVASAVQRLVEPTPDFDGDTVAALRYDGLIAASAALLRALRNTLTSDDFQALRGLQFDALTTALLLHADPAPAQGLTSPEVSMMVEHVDWLLAAQVSFTCQEDRYALTWEDVGLFWCALSRAANSDAFEWFKSGHIIFHECSPNGAEISGNARHALLALLAQHPGPSSFRSWQDEIVAILPVIRAADERTLPLATTSQHVASEHPIHLSSAQQAVLDAYELPEDFEDALSAVAQWVPEAEEAGAIPPTPFAVLHRALASGGSALEHLSKERDFHEGLLEDLKHLEDYRFAGIRLPEPVRPWITELLYKRLGGPHHRRLLHGVVRHLSPTGRLDFFDWLELEPRLNQFLSLWPEDQLPRWSTLLRHLAQQEHGSPWWTLNEQPVSPQHLPKTLIAALPADMRTWASTRHLLGLWERLELFADAQYRQRGPLFEAFGRQILTVDICVAPTTSESFVFTEPEGGSFALDSMGRLQETSRPSAPLLSAKIGVYGQLQAQVHRPDTAPTTSEPLDPGAPVPIAGHIAQLSSVHPAGTAQITVSADGRLQLRSVATNALGPQPHVASSREPSFAFRTLRKLTKLPLSAHAAELNALIRSMILQCADQGLRDTALRETLNALTLPCRLDEEGNTWVYGTAQTLFCLDRQGALTQHSGEGPDLDMPGLARLHGLLYGDRP